MPIIFWWILYTRFVGILCDIKWKYASLINTRLNTVAVQFLSRIKLETIITSHRMTQTSRLQASMHFIVISYMNPIFELISSKKFLNFYRQQKYLVGFLPSSNPLALDLIYVPICFVLKYLQNPFFSSRVSTGESFIELYKFLLRIFIFSA